MKNIQSYTTFKFIAFFSMIIALSVITSCSNETDSVQNNDTNKSSEFITKSTEPVPDTTWEVRSELISWDNGCYKYQISHFMNSYDVKSNEWERILVYSAVMQTGSGCDEEGLITNSIEGPYKGDWIIRDDLLTGEPIRNFYDNNPEQHRAHIDARNLAISQI